MNKTSVSGILVVFGLLVSGLSVSAAHTATVSVSPGLVAGGATETLEFTVTNDAGSTDSIVDIYATVSGEFTGVGSVSCPTDWTGSFDSGVVNCELGAGAPIGPSASGAVSFSITAPSTDTSYDFNVTTTDNVAGTDTKTASVTVDSTPPTGASIEITGTDIGGTLYTSDPAPTLTLSATDATKMAFSCDGSTYSKAVAYATSYSDFDISTSDGCENTESLHTVHAKFLDDAGNSITASNEIFYDAFAPSFGSFNPENGIGWAKYTIETISAVIAENGSGVNESTIRLVFGETYDTTTDDLNYDSGTKTLTFNAASLGLTEDHGIVEITLNASDNLTNASGDVDWSFKIDDTELPAISDLTATPVSGSANINLSWLIPDDGSAPVDYYNVYRSAAEITEKPATPLESNVSTNSYTDTSSAAGTIYHYVVTSVDKAGNESAISNDAEVNVPGATISINGGDVYTNNQNGTVTLSLGKSNEEFTECTYSNDNETSWVEWEAFSSSKTWTLTPTDGQRFVYFKCRNGSIESVSAVDSIILDRNVSRPSTPGASVSSSIVSLDWSDVSDSSGIDYYMVYVNSTSGFTATGEGTKVQESSYSHERGNGDYYYRVKAVDNAGNTSEQSDQVHVNVDTSGGSNPPSGSGGGCSVSGIVVSAPLYAGTNPVTISFRADSKLYDVEFEVKVPSGDRQGYQDLWTGESAAQSVSWTFRENEEGEAGVYLWARDAQGDNCNKAPAKYITVDVTGPEISWVNPASGTTLRSEVELQAEAEDETAGIKNVEFSYRRKGAEEWNSAAVKTLPSSGKQYTHEWDISGLTTGTYEFRATAEDKAGNNAEETIEVRVEGVAPGEELKGTGERVMEAEKEQKEAKKTADYLESMQVSLSEGMRGIYNEAKSKLTKALELELEEKWDEAKTEAEDALALFRKFNGTTITFYETKDYTYSEDSAPTMFAALGLSQAQSNEAAEKLGATETHRRMRVLKVSMGEETFYQVNFVVEVANNSGEPQTIKVVEVIPKEAIASADEIECSHAVEVLVEDPVIQIVLELAAGEKETIIYSNGRHLSKEEADNAIAGDLIQKYSAPPAMFSSGTVIEPSTLAAGGTTGLLSGAAAVALPIAMVIVVIVIVVLFVNFRSQATEKGFEKEFSSQLQSPKEGFLSKVSGKVKEIGKEKQEEHKPRWKWEGG